MSPLNLPPEIRNEIYKYYFNSFSTSWLISGDEIIGLFNHCARLWCLSSQIQHESSSLFFTTHLPNLAFTLQTRTELSKLMKLVPKKYWSSIHGTYRLESSDETGVNYPTTSIVKLIAQNTSYGTFKELERAAGPENTMCGIWAIDIQENGWKIHLSWSCDENPYYWLRESFNDEYDEVLKVTGELGRLPFLESLAML